MTDQYDINIDNYSDEEILKIIKLNTPIDQISLEFLDNHLKEIVNKLIDSNQLDFIEFIQISGEKLKKSIIRENNKKTSYPLIINKLPNAVNNFPIYYPQGKINPIEKRTITKILNIDTLFRKNYNNTISTDFTWTLSQPETNVVSMKVSSIDLPISWYTINDTNNRNTISISTFNLNNTKDKKIILSIPPGNYNNENFIETLNNLFYTNGNTTEFLIAEKNPTSDTLVIRIKNNEEFYSKNCKEEFYCIINFFVNSDKYNLNQKNNEFKKTIGWNIGFRKYEYKLNYNNNIQLLGVKYNGAIESESCLNIKHDNYIFLNLDDFNSNCISQPITSSTWDSYIGNNILARISINSEYNKTFYDNNIGNVFRDRIYLGPVSLERFKIQILNKFGEIINLNNKNFSFTLELTELY